MKAVVAAFNQEKALVGAFSVITNLGIAFVWISSKEPTTTQHLAGTFDTKAATLKCREKGTNFYNYNYWQFTV